VPRILDIHSQADPPLDNLSNFAPNAFELDGVRIAGMEGFLQAIKFEAINRQREVCAFSGLTAKAMGRRRTRDWISVQTLWWAGAAYSRSSIAYQHLLTRAFVALGDNPNFQWALLATEDALLTHRIGHDDPTETVLTRIEFCSRLMWLRDKLKEGTWNIH
jgi:predicted NAD-dependent protein-ADP-ribosyltransferase YbiA (DUF1768 family)